MSATKFTTLYFPVVKDKPSALGGSVRFDFDYAAKLADEDPEAFEIYREQVISDYLNTLPPKKLEKLRALQDQINEARFTLEPLEFMLWLGTEMSKNLDELSSRMVDLHNKVGDHEIIRGHVNRQSK